MKVALVHDWLTGMRGGEKALEVIAKLFPGAPIYTLLYVPGSVSEMLSKRPIHPSLLQKMPLSFSKYRHYLPLFPFFAELNKVKGVDLVVSTNHAVAKAMVKRTGPHKPVHVCYIHTPMRYVWDRFDDYFGPSQVGWFLSTFLFRPVAWLLRKYDRWTVKRVDQFIANSNFVAARVKKFYGVDAKVAMGPVPVEKFMAQSRVPGPHYIMVTALVPYKKVDDAIRACHELGRPLKIVGSGPEEKKLKALAKELGSQTQFLGSLSDEEIRLFYAQGRALIFPGVEDFGLVPVESIASGCPVIGFGQGGLLDSMTHETAIFYPEQSVASLKKGILEFEDREKDFRPEILRKRAMLFSEQNFSDRIKQIIEETFVKYA